MDKCVNENDIVVISVIWFKRQQLSLYNLNGYMSIHDCPKLRKGGGLSIYVKDKCTVSKSLVNSILLACIDYQVIQRFMTIWQKLKALSARWMEKRIFLVTFTLTLSQLIKLCSITRESSSAILDANVRLCKHNHTDTISDYNILIIDFELDTAPDSRNNCHTM